VSFDLTVDGHIFEVSGWSECEWLEGGFFLIERSEQRSGAGVNSNIAIIGYADVSADCVARYYDSEGREDAYTIAVSDRKLIIEWKLYRFAGEFSDDENTIAGVWERSSDGSNWKYWYNEGRNGCPITTRTGQQSY
jgi:hypothetical protein